MLPRLEALYPTSILSPNQPFIYPLISLFHPFIHLSNRSSIFQLIIYPTDHPTSIYPITHTQPAISPSSIHPSNHTPIYPSIYLSIHPFPSNHPSKSALSQAQCEGLVTEINQYSPCPWGMYSAVEVTGQFQLRVSKYNMKSTNKVWWGHREQGDLLGLA